MNQRDITDRNWTLGTSVATELKRLGRLSGFTRSDPLLFCHIPKCAGTSFRAIVDSEYRPDQCLLIYENELDLWYPKPDFHERFAKIRRRVHIIYGHFPFGVHSLIDVPANYATIVREPVARVVSLYDHLARDTSSPFHEHIRVGCSLAEFVEGHFSEMTNNHMTRILTGYPVRPGEVVDGQELLDQAKINVERYFCAVGTTETINEVVRVLGHRFGWRRHSIPVLNVGSQASPRLDQKTLDAIVEHNRLDLELYRWILKRGIS